MKECEIRDVPADRVSAITDDFISEHCINVRAEKQDDGLWRVMASCPVEKECK